MASVLWRMFVAQARFLKQLSHHLLQGNPWKNGGRFLQLYRCSMATMAIHETRGLILITLIIAHIHFLQFVNGRVTGAPRAPALNWVYLVELNSVPRLAKSKFGIYYLASFHQDSEFSRFLWDQSPIANCALGSWKSSWKAHCLLSTVSGGENQKNNFSGSEKLFFEICSWKGLPLQLRFGQLEKHLQYVS